MTSAVGGPRVNLTNTAAGEFWYDWQPVVPAPAHAGLALDATQVTVTEGDSDEVLEPGESGSLSLRLVNKGAALDGLGATLTSSTPGVTVTAGSSAYPDLPPSGAGFNVTPFTFSTDYDLWCGRPVSFTLTVTRAGGGAPQVINFSLPTGQPDERTNSYDYSGGEVPIPDRDEAGVNVPLTVSNFSGSVSDLRFRVGGDSCAAGAGAPGISHSYASDLTLKLTSPRGTTVTLLDAAGGGGADLCNLTLADSAGATVQNLLTADAPFGGTFRPAEPLAAFRGEDPNGVWTLNVSDRAPHGTGLVRGFSLLINGYTCDRAVGGPDLSLTMEAGPDPVEVGSELLYTLTVSNGQNSSSGVRVTDALPAGVSFVSADSSRGSCGLAGGSVVCDIGTLRAYGLAVVTIRVKPTAAGPVSNTASVTSTEADADPSNNTAAVTVTATKRADLVLTNSDTPDPIPVGGSTTYAIKVTNYGPSPASGVVVTARSGTGAVQTFDVGDLAVNASHTVTTGGAGAASGTISMTASVAADETDPRPDNNVAAQNTRVVTLQKFLLRPGYSFAKTVPLPVVGCPNNSQGTMRGELYLTSAAPVGGAVVTLSSTNPKLIVPPSVSVDAGNAYADFTIETSSTVEQPVTGVVTASYAGVSQSFEVVVKPISVAYMFSSNPTLVGGGTSTHTAVLNCSSSPADVVVTLATENPSLAFISNPSDGLLVFSAGEERKDFWVGTNPVSTQTSVKITATVGGQTTESGVTIKP